MGLEALLDRLEARAETAVTPVPDAAVTPKPPPDLGCTAVTPVTWRDHVGRPAADLEATAAGGTASSAAIGETPGWPRPYSEAVRCRDCRHFVESGYPPLGCCAVNQPAPVRGGLFWGIDKRACGAYEDLPAWSVALQLGPASRLRAWLRQLSIDIVVPFDELLAFYHDDLDDLAALSLSELSGLIADYKRYRAEYRRLVGNRLERPAEMIDEPGVTASVVSMAAT